MTHRLLTTIYEHPLSAKSLLVPTDRVYPEVVTHRTVPLVDVYGKRLNVNCPQEKVVRLLGSNLEESLTVQTWLGPPRQRPCRGPRIENKGKQRSSRVSEKLLTKSDKIKTTKKKIYIFEKIFC